jgi:radical SAM superfamily enzyme YgiQ (UPF0313 family)
MERPVEANKYISGLQDQEKRPDLLLVNSPINDYTNVVRPDTEQLPAFGLAHIATECERAGFNVGVVDAEAHALSPEIAAQVINKANPRFVGINMLTPTFPLARRILANLNRDIPIAAGGAHAKAMPERILRDVEIGGRIITLALEDGEYIMRGILDGVPPESMGGVAYLDKHGEFVEVRHDIENKWIPKDLDEMHFADRKFLPLDPLEPIFNANRSPVAVVEDPGVQSRLSKDPVPAAPVKEVAVVLISARVPVVRVLPVVAICSSFP